MELLISLLPVEFVHATGTALNSTLFTTLTSGANVFVGIIKWAALLWVLVKVTMLGFKISTQAKDSASALTMVKNEGLALAIGLFIVLGAFLIHGALSDTMSTIVGSNTVIGDVTFN